MLNTGMNAFFRPPKFSKASVRFAEPVLLDKINQRLVNQSVSQQGFEVARVYPEGKSNSTSYCDVLVLNNEYDGMPSSPPTAIAILNSTGDDLELDDVDHLFIDPSRYPQDTEILNTADSSIQTAIQDINDGKPMTFVLDAQTRTFTLNRGKIVPESFINAVGLMTDTVPSPQSEQRNASELLKRASGKDPDPGGDS